MLTSTWLSLLPPIIVIALAFITQRINLALFIGIVVAGLIGAGGTAYDTGSIILHGLYTSLSNAESLFLYTFLLIIGALIVLISKSGSANACAILGVKRLKSQRAGQYVSVFMSMLLAIDDYLSILTTGFVMRSLLDQLRVARLQLAFLVHSLAGPLVILMPVSGWAAAITAALMRAGVDANPPHIIDSDPFYIYLKTIPYIFYSLLIICSVLLIIGIPLYFGPMKRMTLHSSHRSGYEDAVNCALTIAPSRALFNLVIPIITLLLIVIIGIPIAGGYTGPYGAIGYIDAIRNNDQQFFIMCIAAACSFIIAFLLNAAAQTISPKQLPSIVIEGLQLMFPAVLMVYLASTLSGILRDHVGTADYLATLLIGNVSIIFIPCMLFITSLLCTIATGTAWGTFVLLIPLIIPLLTKLTGLTPPINPTDIQILYPALGALLSGAVLGDHLSPVSETTTMTATSTEVHPLAHVISQFVYAIPAIIATIIGYLISGILITMPLLINWSISFSSALLCCIALLWILHHTSNKQHS